MILEAINRDIGTYLAEDGTIYPITDWFDSAGKECEPDEAVAAVAGCGNCWFALVLANFGARVN